MHKPLFERLKQAATPPAIVLTVCLVVFLSSTAEITRLERQAAPALAELNGFAGKGNGIESFRREYLADPFGKALILSERQLQQCREISRLVPAYESSMKWRNTALYTAFLTLVFLACQRYGARWLAIGQEWRKRASGPVLQFIMRRLTGSLAGRFAKGGPKPKSAPVKKAVVHNIISCPTCHQELRVPCGKGRIRVTCSKCGERFETTT